MEHVYRSSEHSRLILSLYLGATPLFSGRITSAKRVDRRRAAPGTKARSALSLSCDCYFFPPANCSVGIRFSRLKMISSRPYYYYYYYFFAAKPTPSFCFPPQLSNKHRSHLLCIHAFFPLYRSSVHREACHDAAAWRLPTPPASNIQQKTKKTRFETKQPCIEVLFEAIGYSRRGIFVRNTQMFSAALTQEVAVPLVWFKTEVHSL